MTKKIFFLFLLVQRFCFAQTDRSLIYTADFSKPLDSNTWVTEMEQKPGSVSTVYTVNNTLILDTKGGVTVWLNKILTGNICIEYDRRILVDTGRNDRLSDCNQFWMASDPDNKNLFTRNGRFESYDKLQLYYVGMGGNTNTTTRFRKYESNGTKPVIQEYLDSSHLLKANQSYHIKIIVQNGVNSFWVNENCFFTYKDSSPLQSGYFGFRSTWSRQEIRNFRIYTID